MKQTLPPSSQWSRQCYRLRAVPGTAGGSTDAQQRRLPHHLLHVPSAWTAFLLFFINFIASVQYLADGYHCKQAAKWIAVAVGVVGAVAAFVIPLWPGSGRARLRLRFWRFQRSIFFLGKYFPGEKLDV